ncbi:MULTISPECIES: hypothetical protein [unclassified Fusibacter]|uniref:hypothetical protein n=1 Tax=unclassified Fusibacter TaxID=2624464 RepID=UPI001011384A|nr:MULTISPECIES: hypothetical protein [unclassified Fusibacter]MCK8060598.1 hypothetical protein [Fusibacter sp. A2]NPE22948.1 hypothetical protein [Fusibacter sp. A1]RXV60015.1 hypothetical protein DWB64_13980 [Fusibacter sp. A1]
MKKVILLLVAILLVGCQPSGTSLEGRVMAFQAAVADESKDVYLEMSKAFNGLTDDEITAVIEEVPFEVVSEYTDRITESLSLLVPHWKSFDGFNIKYLKNKTVLEQKETETLEFDSFEMTVIVDAPTLESLYEEILDQLTFGNRHVKENLYVDDEDTVVSWSYQNTALTLQSADVFVFDFETGIYYKIRYEDKEISFISDNRHELKYGAVSLVELVGTTLESDFMGLIPLEIESPVELTYETAVTSGSEEGTMIYYAAFSEDGYVPVDDAADRKVQGSLLMKWVIEEETSSRIFLLLK